MSGPERESPSRVSDRGEPSWRAGSNIIYLHERINFRPCTANDPDFWIEIDTAGDEYIVWWRRADRSGGYEINASAWRRLARGGDLDEVRRCADEFARAYRLPLIDRTSENGPSAA